MLCGARSEAVSAFLASETTAAESGLYRARDPARIREGVETNLAQAYITTGRSGQPEMLAGSEGLLSAGGDTRNATMSSVRRRTLSVNSSLKRQSTKCAKLRGRTPVRSRISGNADSVVKREPVRNADARGRCCG